MTFKSIKSIIKENNMEKPEYWDECEKWMVDELLHKYQTAYHILMDHFDDWDSETKTKVHLKLKELDL